MYLHPSETHFSIRPEKSLPFDLHETILEQGSGDSNEDTLSAENNLFVVCDGATSIADSAGVNLKSGGRLAAVITAEVLSANQGLLEDMVARANSEILKAMLGSSVQLTRRESLWSTSFAALRFDGDTIEWAQSGDCAILLIHENGSSELLTELPGHDIATLKKWKEIGPGETRPIHQVLAAEISEVRHGMNRNYGVLNGEREALDFVNYGVKKINSVSDILLFSDGLWLPSEMPEKPLDIGMMAALYKQVGLQGIKQRIRRLQKTDPRCCCYPRFKMHDDISGIALKRR